MISIIKWILTLTQKRPVLGLVAALLIGIGATSAVSIRLYTDYKAQEELNRTDALQGADSCQVQKAALYGRIFALQDTIVSIQARSAREIIDRTDAINQKLQRQLDAQRSLNNKQYKTLLNNKDVISNNQEKINNLKDEKLN